MKNHYAAARRNFLIACAVIALGILGFVYVAQPWLERRAADQRALAVKNAAHQATVRCVEASGLLKGFILEDSKLALEGSTCAVNAQRLASESPAAYDAEVTRCEYESRQARILHATRLCHQWAICDKSRVPAGSFDSCYAVFGPDGMDRDNSPDDVSDNEADR